MDSRCVLHRFAAMCASLTVRQFSINIMAIIAAVVLRIVYGKINKKRDESTEEEVKQRYTDEQLLDMGDKSPLYRYVV